MQLAPLDNRPDLFLRDYAARNNKALRYFETPEQQSAVLALSDPAVLHALQFAIDFKERPAASPMTQQALEKDWQRGRTDEMAADLDRARPLLDPSYNRAALTERNRRFAATIERLLRQPTIAFVAIGAAHFLGNDGVLNLLLADGVSIERVE